MTDEESTTSRAPRSTAAVTDGEPGAMSAEAAQAPTGADGMHPSVPAANTPSDDPQALREDIERTREQLGETVEALAAKADVKAQATDKARQLVERTKETAGQAAAKAGAARSQLASTTAVPRQKLQEIIGPAAEQMQSQASAAAAAVSTATPDAVREAARKAVATARERRVALAVAACLAVLASLVIIRRGRR